MGKQIQPGAKASFSQKQLLHARFNGHVKTALRNEKASGPSFKMVKSPDPYGPGPKFQSAAKTAVSFLLCVDLHFVKVIRIRKQEYDRIRITRLLDLVDIEVQEQVTLLDSIAFSNCR